MEAKRYAVAPGRCILVDGKPAVALVRSVDARGVDYTMHPAEADELTHEIVRRLNADTASDEVEELVAFGRRALEILGDGVVPDLDRAAAVVQLLNDARELRARLGEEARRG